MTESRMTSITVTASMDRQVAELREAGFGPSLINIIRLAVDRMHREESQLYADQSEYEKAKSRVNNTPALTRFSEFILADWAEEDHWTWVINAPVSEIVDWAESGVIDDDLDALETKVLNAEDAAARDSD